MNTPPCLLLALEIDGSDRGNMRVTFVGLGTSRVEWRADLVAGSRFRLASGGVGLWGMRAWGRIGSPILPNFSDRLDVPGVRFRHRGVGDPIVPRSGGRVGASYADVISRGPQAEVPLSWFQRVSQDGSLFSGVSGGGGGHWRANAGLRDVLAGGPVVCHPRAIGESILAWYGGLLAGVAAGATLVRTFIGPVYRGGGYGDRGHGRVFVGVERFFKPGSNCRWRGSDGLDSTC